MVYPKGTSAILLALSLLGTGMALAAETPQDATGVLLGRVSNSTSPLPKAWVYAYELAETTFRKVQADASGDFLFPGLPAGLYKIIAHKSGFVPAIALLSRTTLDARQFLELELIEEVSVGADTDQGFWSARQRVPADVLRDIEGARMAQAIDEYSSSIQPGHMIQRGLFETEMQATAGVDHYLELGEAQLTGGRLGIQSDLGDLRVGISGDFRELQPTATSDDGSEAFSGHTQALSVVVGAGSSASVSVSTLNNRMMAPARSGELSPVDFQRHSVSWNQSYGRAGSSEFSAQYTDEANFYRQGPIEAVTAPVASRQLEIEGSYRVAPTSRSTVQAGFRYRDRKSQNPQSPDPAFLLPQERVDLFGRGGLQVNPAVLVEVGLLSTLRDGSLALAPSGGFVIQLGDSWRASTAASVQVTAREVDYFRQDFMPMLFGKAYRSCQSAEAYCYKVALSRFSGDQEKLSFSATHRKFSDTMRLYFSEDFFDRFESLYLVSGDSLPELQFAMSRRLHPSVLTRLESTLASGGGGTFISANHTPYENQIQFLVTSLDTRFEATSTGVLIALHRLEQRLNPLYSGPGPANETFGMELDRLQIALTQDLDFLRGLSSDWAVRLNMEVSRGATPDTQAYDEDALRKSITGGIAVKF